jgi:hypothetical protein
MRRKRGGDADARPSSTTAFFSLAQCPNVREIKNVGEIKGPDYSGTIGRGESGLGLGAGGS